MPELILHLVRHGETAWNAERRIQGQLAHVELNERGWEQARELADALADCGASAIISSDLKRAWDTANVIAERLRLPVTSDTALREKNFGIVQGKLYTEAAEIMGEWWKRHDERVEGGETNREMFARVAAFLDHLRESPPAEEVIVVSHGGVMNVALAHLRGETVDTMAFERLENCALRTLALGDPRQAALA
jgi:probable phosphoglycerate mutase